MPAGETTVQGFEVSENGGASWTRSGFSAEIVGAAVELVRETGTWPAGTQVRYCANGPLDYGRAAIATQLIHGTLYESGPVEGGLGLPLAGLYEATSA